LGGGTVVLWLVPEGPFRSRGSRPKMGSLRQIFRHAGFRDAASGYFGHMWELYTFWAFVPVMLQAYAERHQVQMLNMPLWSFACIAIGGPACVLGGYLSRGGGAKKIATLALFISGLCCLAWPLVFLQGSLVLFLAFMLTWGAAVVADSPLFSTLVAQHAPAESRGTALTLVVCIGFAITIVSIQLVNLLQAIAPPTWLYMVLAAGPVLGLRALVQKSG
ncbi:MAG TPA: MFS transporter, partial [Phnomibacter sp.]|nr:MFS transporter [Phnomibacter sp.]